MAGDSPSNGMSTTSSGSPGGAGTGLLILPQQAAAPEPGRGTRLLLADERLKPPPFSSRLFRPPR